MYITPVLVNRHKGEFDEYIGRGTKWGNPYERDPGKGWSKLVVIEMYREHLYDCLLDGTLTINDFLELSGKRIGCSCAPAPCHGDVIIEIFNEIVAMIENNNET